MSGPFGSPQWMYSSGFYPHEIGNSARFDTNSYISRTPSSTGNRKTYTISTWVKFCKFPGAVGQAIWAAGVSGARVMAYLYNETLNVNRYDGTYVWSLQTDQLFRDPSAWYHIVIAIDTTDSTASDRVKIYVNGDRVTTFETTPVYPALNLDTYANNTVLHTHGASPYNSLYLNGYLAEINFIDGTALTADSFGETKADTWIPKKYTGSYGTNGYYLDFATRATDPIDASDNGNNFGSVNVVSTDWMLDSPTNNWATLNPLGPRVSGANFGTGTQTQGNLTATSTSTSYFSRTSSTIYNHANTGKWYYEIRMDSLDFGNTSGYVQFNIGGDYVWRYYGNSNTLINTGGSFTSLANGDIVMIAIDQDNGKGWFGINGSWYNVSGAPDPAAGTYPHTTFTTLSSVGIIGHVELRTGSAVNTVTINFGQDSSFAGQATAQGNTDANGLGDFYYSPPAGFLALCSANMPDPATDIDPAVNNSPQDHFNPILYTGNGSTQAITGVGFQPDLVWIKKRNSAASHGLHDVNRIDGTAEEIMYSDSTAASNTGGAYISSFDSDGFTANNNSSGNASGDTFVSWNWKAGGTGVSNTTGGIASTVSANPNIGVSFIKWQGDSNTSGTVGTGLSSSAPLDMAIVKRRDSTSDWHVGHRFSGQGVNFAYHTNLNDTAALSGSAPYMMGTQSSSNGDRLYITGDGNINTAYYIAYCFQSVEGFSKFGSYTGNGNADGPFIHTGFRPAFVIVKNASSSDSWFINDNKRNSYNLVNSQLFANSANAEADSRGIDFLSNGFKIRDASTTPNGNGNTLIYMAFAEMPFKYANAR